MTTSRTKSDKLDNQTHTGGDKQVLLYADGFMLRSGKTSPEGEDALPIWKLPKKVNETGFIAVCDGLGGAGSTKYNVDGHARTGAYIASGNVVKRLRAYYNERQITQLDFWVTKADVQIIQQVITDSLQCQLAQLQQPHSLVRSSMIKLLPTTMAGVFYNVTKTTSACAVLWAGDSRVYCFDVHGLRQLSEDDVSSRSTAALIQDEPMNNYIHASGTYHINYREYSVDVPCILFAATDGTYGYVSSPMHFEQLILDTLQKSSSKYDWECLLHKALTSIAGDDFSLSLVWFGWSDVREMYVAFKKRHQYITRLLAENNISKAWEQYRKQYEAYR